MGCQSLLQGTQVPNLGIEPGFPALQADSLLSKPTCKLKGIDLNVRKIEQVLSRLPLKTGVDSLFFFFKHLRVYSFTYKKFKSGLSILVMKFYNDSRNPFFFFNLFILIGG